MKYLKISASQFKSDDEYEKETAPFISMNYIIITIGQYVYDLILPFIYLKRAVYFLLSSSFSFSSKLVISLSKSDAVHIKYFNDLEGTGMPTKPLSLYLTAVKI